MKINPKDLQQIIKEEALRLKRKMMLESEKESILKRLQEIEECEMMEDAPGMGAPVMGGGSPDVQIKPEVANAIERNAQAVMAKVTPDQMAKAAAELQAAGLMGGSEEQIKDKVEEMLPINESMMNEAWDKSKIYNWLVGGGLGATAAGIVTMVLGSMPTQELSNLADYTGATVTPGPAVIAGLITLAIGAIGVGIGMKGHNTLAADKGKMSPEQAQRIIAQRKAQGRR
jgi:hypothetical protein